MAQSREEKAAKAIAKALDSMGLNPATVAHLTINEMTQAHQRVLFDFVMNCVDQFANDPLTGPVSADRAQRFMVCQAMKEAIENEGYILG